MIYLKKMAFEKLELIILWNIANEVSRLDDNIKI